MIKPASVHFLFLLLPSIMFPVLLEAKQLPSYEKYQGPLKPGIQVNQDNLNNYLPELKKLLPPAKLKWLIMGITKGIISIPIVKTTYPPLTQGQREASWKYMGTARVAANNQLLDWTAGVPFPEPKSAVEIAWNACPTISRASAHEDILFYGWFGLFKKAKFEKHFKWEARVRKYRGRTDIAPLGDMPDFTERNVCHKEPVIITEPHEVRGFIQLRTKFWDVDKPDECYAYIPALRRMRRLTGKDTTDPMLGSDAVFDDFEVWRQKLDSRMKFRVLEFRDYLAPRTYIGRQNKPPYDYRKQGPFLQIEWEIRPQWVLEVMINNSNYVYSKRIIYIDGISLDQGGTFLLYWGEQYDQKGRLCKANGNAIPSDNGKGYKNTFSFVYINNLTSHYTLMDSYTAYSPEDVFKKTFPLNEDRNFTIKGLFRRAR